MTPIADWDRRSPKPSYATPRVSTPAPLDVPRWDDGGYYDDPLAFDFSSLLIDNPAPISPSPVALGGGQMRLRRPQEMLPELFDLSAARTRYAANNAANAQIGGIGAQAQGGGGGGRLAIPKGGTGHAWQRGTGKFGLQADFWAKLVAAQRAMAAAGLGQFGVTDGFRSYAQQVVAKRKKGKLAATPGRSRHGLGRAADLSLTRAQQKWLEANGAKYGLRRLKSESWHWEDL